MNISEAKRVFLSHKGVNKDIVIDFKETLELLGYEPWLDEDAMPAGTPLERGLLQGMKDSCGVVFFVTPEFKDEGYLETEINYAMSEKRRKKDKFAIVPLLFVGDDNRVAEIPDLLGTLVYKKPKTQLEALQETIRALPVAPGPVDWRDEVTGVATVPQIKSTSAELSDEAKALLGEAVISDGSIMHMRFIGGETISVNNKPMMPDQDHRTIARWTGGLEDLQRRRYIKDIGHEGKVFEVTREGYDAADELGLSLPEHAS
ncbi:MAG: toll/interleukin-1 receptor domain-containing protein [Caldilineaceae bacterium SB0661_bin_32]|uniref:Toll/interleukin-1 receptor domain-containing protein n=1 Tax=Caldilineaceae bacterium SB0661_bin_32 TaxID=2605255 RepID=A0A6B1D6J2_9CHLR|nr:toll/interleukin-1 receptor domain-containing protein [Caldilineaceae bacterium SB0661_bin_32]